MDDGAATAFALAEKKGAEEECAVMRDSTAADRRDATGQGESGGRGVGGSGNQAWWQQLGLATGEMKAAIGRAAGVYSYYAAVQGDRRAPGIFPAVSGGKRLPLIRVLSSRVIA
ncbi:hypothetical protein FQN55_006544 [Onygenales sp. PD_40]|nr:hypothetical protein FQN55_006544 [Onygenales sp. PD_40]